MDRIDELLVDLCGEQVSVGSTSAWPTVQEEAIKRRDARHRQIADDWRAMVEALDAMLDWALSNRDTKHEFVTCRSEGDPFHPALAMARAALSRARGEGES